MVEGIASAAMDNTTYECTARKKKVTSCFHTLLLLLRGEVLETCLFLPCWLLACLLAADFLVAAFPGTRFAAAAVCFAGLFLVARRAFLVALDKEAFFTCKHTSEIMRKIHTGKSLALKYAHFA